MSRYINLDDIEWYDHHDADGNISSYKVAYSDEMPESVDAVPVVRCRDCKWCSHFTDGHIECRLLYDLKPVPRTYMQMREDDYCSYGEKVTENG